LDARIVEKQLMIVQKKGYQGYCLFAYHTLSDEMIDMLKKFN